MRSLMMMILLVGVSACGETDQSAAVDAATIAEPADTSSAVAEAGGETIAATRAQVEEAWKCRGLISAAAGAKQVLPASEVPAALSEVDTAMTLYWTDRAARLKAPDMSEADVDALVVSSTRNLVTREALERELPTITACIAAQKGA